MTLDLETMERSLAMAPSIIEGLIAGAPADALTWQEADAAWTPVQVIAHLADAEITDWMPRVERILADGGDFPWYSREAGFARYQGWTAMALVGEFGQLRRANLEKIAALRLTEFDLTRTGVHPEFGRVTLGQLLATWTTHDLAHVAQLSRILTRALGRHVGPWRQYFSLLAARGDNINGCVDRCRSRSCWRCRFSPARRRCRERRSFPGWYADPEAHVFEHQYWIYPTTRRAYDQQTFLDAFSSPDLVTWTKHPHILDIADVPGRSARVWAPSIVEKDGWYYLFFGANDIQNDREVGGIGVARSRTPDGPFKDYLGHPLIDAFHNGAQPIDQMVFQDRDGAWYIVYGGWRHCNIARLNDDFTGLVPLPDGTHVQGDHAGRLRRRLVHADEGRQVLLHVVGRRLDRSELRRRVRGRLVALRAVRARRQDPAAGSRRRDRAPGTTRSCIADGSDNWYIVYHRRPLGETDRNHRVVCIDELRFDRDGFILPVRITVNGVARDPLR